MEFPLSPQSSPSISAMSTGHIQDTLQYFCGQQPGDVFQLLLDLDDGMRSASTLNDFLAAGDLLQVNQLFLAVIHHSAYGVCQRVDRVINRLLLMAVRRCEEMRQTQVQLDRGTVWWQSFAQSQASDHLEFYRNFLSFITDHPAWCLSQDPNLELAQKTMQRLCPRVNGLSIWGWRDDGLAETRDGDARPRGPSPAQSSTPRPQPPPAKKPPSRRPRRAPGPLPTPPTQTGDVNLADTIPTMPLKRPWKPAAALLTPHAVSGALSRTMGRDVAFDKQSDDAPQLLSPRTGSVGGGPRHCVLSRPAAHQSSGFKLRPEHTPSARCCVTVASEVWDCSARS